MFTTVAHAPNWGKNRANTARGLLVYGEAQCSGYARGMVALFDAVGIELRYVHASKGDPTNPNHQWNFVKLDGKWYHLDVQMMDSSFAGANKHIVLMNSHLTCDFQFDTCPVSEHNGINKVFGAAYETVRIYRDDRV